MSNLQLRLLSAIVLIPIVLGAIIIGGNVFALFVIALWLLSLYEWTKLSLKTEKKIKAALFGFFYLTFCFYEFSFLRRNFDSGLYLVVTMLLVIWAADTGAYFVGRKYGKHKMAPSISPNKSWEGMIGAMVASALVLALLITFAPDLSGLIPNNLSEATFFKSIVAAICGAAFAYIGQMGDLIESFLKRRAGAKDSGNLIPGHGGILDRVDSLLLVSPFFVLFAIYVL